MPSYHFGIEHSRARLERNLFGERPDRVARSPVWSPIYTSTVAPLGALHGPADAAERVEVVIDRRHPELGGLEVLVTHVDIGERLLEELRLAFRYAAASV